MTHLPLPTRVNIDHAVEHSFKDMHQKGFHYLCLNRSHEETIKLYFFDGDVNKLPEVVAPHEHRYDFETYCAAGAVENVWFQRALSAEMTEAKGQMFNWFEYRTPMNGGNGFTFAGEECLYERHRARFISGESYYMQADDLHTIRIAGNDTVLMLVQFEDIYPIEKPTSTFFKDQAPSLDGLYTKFTADEVIALLRRFEERTGILLQQHSAAA
jgi:hypothetical protein